MAIGSQWGPMEREEAPQSLVLGPQADVCEVSEALGCGESFDADLTFISVILDALGTLWWL